MIFTYAYCKCKRRFLPYLFLRLAKHHIDAIASFLCKKPIKRGLSGFILSLLNNLLGDFFLHLGGGRFFLSFRCCATGIIN